MKRPKGLAGQMAKQMHTTKGAAKGMLVRAKKMNDEEGFQGGGPVHHSPSSGVRRLSDSIHQPRPRYFVRGGGVAVRGNTYRGVS
jgi:hypothetical protein